MLRFLFLVFLFIFLYYVLKIILGIIIPIIKGKSVYSNYSSRKYYNPDKREGDVTIEYPSKKNKKYSKEAGKYIDYKEID